ncbi:uncharacterized protein LOC129806847 isoform X3 [Phlebotomus papatasi]|uniref:uncharacterized protein LOC129806847 isoform X3 n=1 Tax=Phlebotomus papatasi TaxID=29031 RepID=UPI00248341EA|nr:uncharacterized protein LOC129806847 isoform X3 [Phlebotomus papatasi]
MKVFQTGAMGIPAGIFWILALMLIFNEDSLKVHSQRQSARSSGPTARAFGVNPKQSSSTSTVDFDCPEEFGYYPHPTDCTQYYVCVFGSALLESCTGGLMYSHELQTCDWPRNVGCDAAEAAAPVTPATRQQQAQVTRVPQIQQVQPQKIRFTSVPSVIAGPSSAAQIQAIPPPPELRVAPNPVITSRGQPKQVSLQEDIAQLYADAHDTLPPAEEEESDRQQRVYRGQPSTVGQVQRDRDGILQQSSVNAIPSHGKVGSFAFGSQVNQYRVESSSPASNSYVQPQKVNAQNTRNYYNTTQGQYDQYDPYAYVYDEDVELYRDVDYGQQYNGNNNQKPQHQSTYRPPIITSPTPATVSPTPTHSSTYAPVQAHRDAYVHQQPQQYERPAQVYTTDYEDDDVLLSQLEQEGLTPYNQGTRQGLRTNNPTRGRGSSHYSTSGDQHSTVTSNRGTHPPRARPTLKPSQTIVSKAQEYIDIYRFPPWRPDPVYPQPTPDKTAAKCRKDVCLLPDCFCGGKDIPGDMPVEHVPQIVLLTFDDSVNDLNKQLYMDLFEKGRVNPNGCPITATFYVSHEWTDYSQVQNLYADGHEMASHTVSHSFGEQFSQKKWTREVAGQREILAAYGGVKLEDVRGMRAPFLSIGGNKMFKMLYDSNFTYDSSMPVYENRPPSWPYTLDYKIFHDCMIPPCPTKSYPGVWEVPMVMWQDLNGGRCSMGDACANPPDAEGVVKMLMKNFERHYTTNRAPFGLYYHAAWFTQPHHKEGFIAFLDAINAMKDVWIVTNWQALQWVRDPTPISRLNSFQPFQCNYAGRPKRCNNPKVCNLWHKSGVRYMRTCQPCPDIYPWTGKSGIRSSRVDNDIEE